MQRTLFLLLCLGFVAACGATPRERYIRAMDAQYRGDGKAYLDELIALAHDEPNSREGRRARAILTSSNVWAPVALVGAVAVGMSSKGSNTAPASTEDAPLFDEEEQAQRR